MFEWLGITGVSLRRCLQAPRTKEQEPPLVATMSAGVALQVANSVANMLFERSRLANLVGVPFGLVICWVLSDTVPRSLLIVWFFAKLIGAGWREVVGYYYQRAGPCDPKPWLTHMQIAIAFDGLVFAAFGFLAQPDQILSILAIATEIGCAALALIVLGMHFPIMATGVITMIVPNIAIQLWIGSRPAYYCAIGGAVFLILALVDGRRSAAHTADMLGIRFRLDELAEQRAQALMLAERHSEEKSEFLANMSHEMRTPMHAILSFTTLARKKIDLPEERRDSVLNYLQRIDESGKRLLKLLNNLLDLSRLEAGMMKYDVARCDFGEIAHSIVTELEGVAEDKGVTIVYVPPNESALIEADAEKLEQVCRNLLGNAIKFTPAGRQVRLSVSQRPEPGEGHETTALGREAVQFVVSDEGIGIPVDERAVIFDKFVQSSRNKTGASGTGLGLAIARRIVIDHGGAIEVRESSSGGAEFVVTLPKECRLLRRHSEESNGEMKTV